MSELGEIADLNDNRLISIEIISATSLILLLISGYKFSRYIRILERSPSNFVLIILQFEMTLIFASNF